MAQVKFYSVSALPATPNADGVYFVQGGELYKGTSRFGAAKIFTATTQEQLNAITGMITGDINVGFGPAKVYNGTSWVNIGADISAVQSQWQADISSAISSAMESLGDAAYVSTADSITADAETLPTCSAVADYVEGAVSAAVTGGSNSNGSEGVAVEVVNAQTTAAPTVTVTITKATLNTTLGTTNVADKTIATSIGATGVDTALATEKAVRDAITVAASSFEMLWLDENDQPLQDSTPEPTEP